MTAAVPWHLSIPKNETRLNNISGLINSRVILDRRAGKLRRDWIELAGPGAPTLELLIDKELLTPGGEGKFIAVDTNQKVLDEAKEQYGEDAPAEWVRGDLIAMLKADTNAFPNAGALIFDSLNAAKGRAIEECLEVLFDFAHRRKHTAGGEFYLVLNVSTIMVEKGADWYKKEVAGYFGKEIPDDAWVEYKSSARSKPMLLTRLRFGF